jgi:hypothetical protein
LSSPWTQYKTYQTKQTNNLCLSNMHVSKVSETNIANGTCLAYPTQNAYKQRSTRAAKQQAGLAQRKPKHHAHLGATKCTQNSPKHYPHVQNNDV